LSGAKEGKQSFFEKEDQKTFVSSLIGQLGAIWISDCVGTASKTKVFALPHVQMRWPWAAARFSRCACRCN
jgi:hypothetical protein